MRRSWNANGSASGEPSWSKSQDGVGSRDPSWANLAVLMVIFHSKTVRIWMDLVGICRYYMLLPWCYQSPRIGSENLQETLIFGDICWSKTMVCRGFSWVFPNPAPADREPRRVVRPHPCVQICPPGLPAIRLWPGRAGGVNQQKATKIWRFHPAKIWRLKVFKKQKLRFTRELGGWTIGHIDTWWFALQFNQTWLAGDLQACSSTICWSFWRRSSEMCIESASRWSNKRCLLYIVTKLLVKHPIRVNSDFIEMLSLYKI